MLGLATKSRTLFKLALSCVTICVADLHKNVPTPSRVVLSKIQGRTLVTQDLAHKMNSVRMDFLQ